MTKDDIVKKISSRTGLEHQAVQVIVEEMMTTIKENMANGKNVYFRGFGTFEIVHRAEKIGRDITKNTSVIVPEHNTPKFKPCPEFKEMVK